MQFKGLIRAAAIFSCAIALFTSCITVNKELGDDFIPNDEKIYLKTVDIPLPLTANKLDSLQGRANDYFIIGNFRTQEFGLATFTSAANLALTSSLDFGKNAVLKSIRLVIPVSSAQYINDTQDGFAENILVYRTNKVIDSTFYYQNSFKSTDYNPTPINASPATYLGNDSLVVFLDKSLGEDILSATGDQLDSNSLFMEKVKGLYIVANPMENPILGGRISLMDLNNAYVRMKINFTPTWESGLAAKDTTINIKLGNGFCLNTSSYSNEADAAIGNTSLKEIPCEGIAGIKPYISATALKSTLQKWAADNNYNPERIVVSKATIKLPYTPPADYNYDNYPNSLYPVYKESDTTNYHYFYPIGDIYKENNHGAMNKSLNMYIADASTTIQKLLNKDASTIVSRNEDLWFTAITSYEDPYYYTVTYFPNTTGYFIGNINGPASSNPPILTLVYTVIPE